MKKKTCTCWTQNKVYQEVSNMLDWSRYEHSTCTNQSEFIFK